jgi:hypothetical protein
LNMPNPVLPQALAAQPGAYELLMAELQKAQPVPRPMFTPEQAGSRVRNNEAMVGLGMLGQLSGDQQMGAVGGQVFRQALGDRSERVTNRGIQDPLTGETSVDPEFARQEAESRRGKILEKALQFEDQRQRAIERAQQASATEAERSQRAMEVAQLRADTQQSVAAMRAGSAADTRSTRDELAATKLQIEQERLRGIQEKRIMSANKVKELADSAHNKASTMIANLDRAEKMVGPMTTGLLGAASRNVPMTQAYDLNKLMDTIKAGIGFGELQQMRIESPTGGALGQVAIRELEMLQAVLGNLDTAQSPATLKDNIDEIRTRYQNIQKALGGYRPERHYEVPATDIAPPPVAAPPGAGDPIAGVSAQPQRVRRRLGPDGKLIPVGQ